MNCSKVKIYLSADTLDKRCLSQISRLAPMAANKQSQASEHFNMVKGFLYSLNF